MSRLARVLQGVQHGLQSVSRRSPRKGMLGLLSRLLGPKGTSAAGHVPDTCPGTARTSAQVRRHARWKLPAILRRHVDCSVWAWSQEASHVHQNEVHQVV